MMRVYVLHFETQQALKGAFARIMQSERVTSCSIDAGESEVRFAAPERWADPLVERLYAEGGLIWCTRHALVEKPFGLRRRG